MPLFRADHEPHVAPDDAIAVVHEFVTRCRAWAVDRAIPERIDRLRDQVDPEASGSLHRWVSYVAFLDHTLRELENGTLDDWFEPPVVHRDPP